ncbi:hypothetical protein MGYG_04903 [Nannizzia gypsea CBS 118893]|uniref:Uncharacterized protein n=1 Tax=Arthroderma gypseum (strain ATCC MYA-4604 / CBS 118893) TaxID=535722 RepID=E4UXF5_ARTGP|nr:hypothetical protein MGYG_04903 [Nannizzia gypsea CBS 118893]EFR01903.1 hypothetical protein MGYG_04903 [Nannizzia gypsea CBS 118893]
MGEIERYWPVRLCLPTIFARRKTERYSSGNSSAQLIIVISCRCVLKLGISSSRSKPIGRCLALQEAFSAYAILAARSNRFSKTTPVISIKARRAALVKALVGGSLK